MANVRYTGGGSSATLGTKTIDENGIYNASSDNLDGYSEVTVEVPQPSGTISLEYTTNGERTVDVADYENANINVSVPAPVQPTQEKTVNAQIDQVVVTPDTGYLLRRVTVDPQRNFDTYTPQPNDQYNDMGVVNRYRYVDTRGMITPSGTKEVTYNNNGTHTEDVTDYTGISVEVDVPVSGDLGTKTITVNGTYTALDDGLDGYSEVDVNVPQNATLGIKTITNNGNYNAITDGYDGYSRVDVNVAGATLQTSKSVTATTSQQTVTPDVGYDGMEQVIVNPQVHTQTYTPADNTAANDMGVNNNYRYVNTSGMYTPTSITPSNSTPGTLTSGSAVMPTTNGLAISSMDSVTPSSTPTSVSSGDIVKVGGNGVIVDSIPTPTSITPSNSSPVALSANTPVNPTANGYAIESYSSITPSSSSPATITSGSIYKASADGKAVKNILSPTPSDSNPPNLNNTSAVYKPTASGYLYSTVQPKVATGSFTSPSTGSTISITCGFKPKKICLVMYTGSNSMMTISYDVDMDSSRQIAGWRTSSSNYGCQQYAFPNSSNNGVISEITSNSFVYRAGSTSLNKTVYYFAIG